MALYGPNGGITVGGPISPFFGAQNGASPVGGPIIQQPVGMPMVVAVSQALIPANALVTSVNSQNAGTGDPMSVLEAMNDGNGNQANGGIGCGSVAKQQAEQQEYAVGLSAVAMTQNGPTTCNTDPMCISPVPAGIPCDQWSLSGFIG